MCDPSNYQAIVFAGGRGNRMSALTDCIPKALLPVSNIPMFWYPLNMLCRNGITDCILLVDSSTKTKVESLLGTKDVLPSLPGMKINVVSFSDDDEGEDIWGTGDVLTRIRDKIHKDLIIVSGDLVSDLSIKNMLEFHNSSSSLLTCLLTDSALNGPTPGPKERQKKYRDYSAIVQNSKQLFFLMDEDDFGEEYLCDENMFFVSKNIELQAKYKDVHVYVMKKSILSLFNHKSFSSIKADLIPYLLEAQYTKAVNKDVAALFPSVTTDQESVRTERYRCYAYFTQKEDASIIAQCNNVGSYFEANKSIHRILNKLCSDIGAGKKFEKSSGITMVDSFISDRETTILEKAQIKRSIVGPKVSIDSASKIDNSILMEGVKVKSGASIKNCIVFPGVELGENCDLNTCIVIQSVHAKDKISFSIIHAEKEMNLDDDE